MTGMFLLTGRIEAPDAGDQAYSGKGEGAIVLHSIGSHVVV